MRAGDRDAGMVLSLDPLTQELLLLEAQGTIRDPEVFIESLKRRLPGCIVQAVDAKSVVDSRQIQAAAFLALTCGDKGGWIKDPSLRFLAFLSGDRQVERAIERVGIRAGEGSKILIIMISEDVDRLKPRLEVLLREEGLESVQPVLPRSDRRLGDLMERHKVAEEELRASRRGLSIRGLSEILIERMVILSLEV